jgi:hypothetical protein
MKDIGGKFKFPFFERYEVGRLPDVRVTAGHPICLLYVLWSRPEYVNMLLVSLASNLIWTDVANQADVVLMTDEQMDVSPIMDHYAGIQLLRRPRPLNRYLAMCDPFLKRYEKVVTSCCDTYAYGKCNLYQRVLAAPFNVAMCKPVIPVSVLNMLPKRRPLTCFPDDVSFVNAIAGLSGVSPEYFSEQATNTPWRQGCFWAARPGHLDASLAREFYELTKLNSDETFLGVHAIKRGDPVNCWDDMPGMPDIRINFDPRILEYETPMLAHPFTGTGLQAATAYPIIEAFLRKVLAC